MIQPFLTPLNGSGHSGSFETGSRYTLRLSLFLNGCGFIMYSHPCLSFLTGYFLEYVTWEGTRGPFQASFLPFTVGGFGHLATSSNTKRERSLGSERARFRLSPSSNSARRLTPRRLPADAERLVDDAL